MGTGAGDQLDFTPGGTKQSLAQTTDMPKVDDPSSIGDSRFDVPNTLFVTDANDTTTKAEDRSNVTIGAAGDIEDQDDEEADRLREPGEDVDEDDPKGKKGKGKGEGRDGEDGSEPGTHPSSALGTDNPTNQVAPASNQTPSMPSSSMPSMSSPSMPLSNMTQSDLANAPNRNDLVKELKDSETRSKGELGRTGDADEDAVRELAEKIVNAEPPIPYSWGGGHGSEPGPSVGIRDGGVADSFGDYKKSGLDCSGLARYMTHLLYGVDINGTSQNQYSSGTPISASQARAGDIFFPDSAGRPPTHVQVYVGNNQVIEAQKSGTYMKFSPLTSGDFRRFA